ncbi:hypothetical protein ACQP3D_27190, partial [Escherichia coli]
TCLKNFENVTLPLTLWYFVNSVPDGIHCKHFTWECSSNISQRTSCFVLSAGDVGPEEAGEGMDTLSKWHLL